MEYLRKLSVMLYLPLYYNYQVFGSNPKSYNIWDLNTRLVQYLNSQKYCDLWIIRILDEIWILDQIVMQSDAIFYLHLSTSLVFELNLHTGPQMPRIWTCKSLDFGCFQILNVWAGWDSPISTITVFPLAEFLIGKLPIKTKIVEF